MPGKMPKKRGSNQKKNGRGFKNRVEKDSFFDQNEQKRRRLGDEYIQSDEDGESGEESGREDAGKGDGFEEAEETPAEKRLRLAYASLEQHRERERKKMEDKNEAEDDDEFRHKEGEIDSLVINHLQQKQLEESTRTRRRIAAKIQQPGVDEEPRFVFKHWQPVTAVALSEDDDIGFSASKDGSIVQWNVDHRKVDKYQWPSEEVLRSHGFKDTRGFASKKKKSVLALAVSSDCRYLATGGLDRHVHLWDIRTRQHVQAFPGHKGPVSCLTFRLGTSELFSGSFDRSIKIWNADDRTYMNTLFGHQSEVLTIDSLRKERVLTVGRDRTMHLWKVPEESQLVYRAPACSLECCCYIGNDDFLSGSDDGSIELWNVMRKKPVHIFKNAHATPKESFSSEGMSNGHSEEDAEDTFKPSSAALSWVSSVAVCRNSDLAASGAGNGSIRLWLIEDQVKGIRPLFALPQAGFVNSLVFAKSGKFLVAGVGKEPRLGRWGRAPAAKNGVVLHKLSLQEST